jgi:two-component system chemotaxis sensor kinase CheA
MGEGQSAEPSSPQPAGIKEQEAKAPKAASASLPVQEQASSIQNENKSAHQSIISVDVTKLDKLMDLMGEMVIAEAMVTQNPELQSLKLNSFYKAARQLQKITSEMQDMIMSIRMVPLSATFQKMHRIVRDMSRKLNKEVQLKLIGEETEVDKNIIEHISDPLMHLVRNSIDHGIEMADERAAAGKPREGHVTLEAQNAGSDVLVIVRDDGKGLNKEKILKKAIEHGLINKSESEMTDREIYNLIFLPGFSTNDSVTEYSGRGVGMDVVLKNLEAIGGSAAVDSTEGEGTVTTLKIPLTLAIIDGMNIRVGDARYTLPTVSIQETFRAKGSDTFQDTEGNEMIMVRGQCYPILRLHKIYAIQTEITDLTRGIMLMVEQDGKSVCLFADELLGQHQVVFKALPGYIKNTRKIDGLAGCTLLGDGSISLILNIGRLINM